MKEFNVVEVRNDLSIVSIEDKDCNFVITLVLIFELVEKSRFKRLSRQARSGVAIILVLEVGGATLKGDV